MPASISAQLRRQFDDTFEQVLEEAPPLVHQALEEIPVILEDHPSQRVLLEMSISHPAELFGLFHGTPKTEQSVERPVGMPDRIEIYRLGLLRSARNFRGGIDRQRLKEQIRITLLHEVGHYYGLDEDDLAERGYG